MFRHMKTSSRLRRIATPLVVAAMFSLFPVTVALADKDDHVEARALLQRGEILPLARILEVAQRRVPGDVIEVELEREDSGWEYEVKVLTPAGLVRKLTLDARNGAVLKVKDD
jgi:uncharacterized membrane protein YkoI